VSQLFLTCACEQTPSWQKKKKGVTKEELADTAE
jgi:hypothetical protein